MQVVHCSLYSLVDWQAYCSGNRCFIRWFVTIIAKLAWFDLVTRTNVKNTGCFVTIGFHPIFRCLLVFLECQMFWFV